MIESLLTDTTAAATATIPTTDTRGRILMLFSTRVVNNTRIIIPKIIGTRTICTIDINISPADTGSHLLANNNVKAGVTIGANTVETAVIVTDRAVFPLAKNVITFDAVPPGQQPTKITPTATSAGN